MSERQNLPRPAPDVTTDGVPAAEELPEELLRTGDTVEGDMPPLDRPQAAKDWGTTASEQLGQEPLDMRVNREVPDTGAAESGVDTGHRMDEQLLEPGAESGLLDEEPDAVGETDVGLEDTLSAEESAVRVVDEPAGLNYDPDPGYVDHEEENG